MSQKRLILPLLFCLPLLLSAKDELVFSTPLSEGVDTLRKAGWTIPDKGFETVDGSLQITATNGVRNFATYDLPVEQNSCYGGSVMVRALNVSRPNGGRGATLFFGFLDENRDWVNGGEFPTGPVGTTEWQKVSISMTRLIPTKVRYIQIWLAIEGQGSAQFKDLQVCKRDLVANWSVNADSNPPSFSFDALENSEDPTIQPRIRILLSQNPDFPEAETFMEMAPNNGNFTFPYALEPGKWYAKAHWCMKKVLSMSKPIAFTVKPVPQNPPLKVTPKFANGQFNAMPELAFSFYPQAPQSCTATMAGQPLAISSDKGNEIVFTPTAPIAKGTHDIVVTANGGKHKFLFVNKSPAHTYSFRDDHMLMIDGKPFFPIGTYRDPSDDLKVFDGIEEAQFNVTHSYQFENNNQITDDDMVSYLNDCQKHNVYAFMGIPRRHLYDQDFYALQKHCAAMYDHPNLLSIYLADEPECWIDRYSMKHGADAVKQACSGVPRILLLCTADIRNDDVMFLGNGLSEIFWHDPYPIPRSSITDVKTNMETMRTVCRDKQSLWCVVQAFDWDQYAVKNKKPEDVEPKAGKIRCMTHLALAANVQGIIYYWLPNDRYDMRIHSPIQWAETIACSRELNSLYKYLIGRNKPQNITLPEGIDYWCRQAADGSYALGLVNTTDKAMSFDIKVLGFEKTVTLGPWGVEVLK